MKINIKKHIYQCGIFVTICWLISFSAYGQLSSDYKNIIFASNNIQIFEKLNKSLLQKNNISQAQGIIDSWLKIRAKEGYAEAALDSLWQRSDTLFIALHRGPKYTLQSLVLRSLPQEYWHKSELDRLEKKALNWGFLGEKMRNCLDLYREKGYPFAAFDSLKVQYKKLDKNLNAYIFYQFETGPLVRIDSIHIKGKKREKDAFVYALMRLQPGQLYDQKSIQDIPRLLNNSIYYKNVKIPKLSFSKKGKSLLEIDLKQKKAGSFDVLLGILPPADAASGKVQFTGLADVVLVSSFEMGEKMEFHYKKLTSSSQRLEMRYEQPYLLGSSFSGAVGFEIHKQEERYLNRQIEFDGQYALSPFMSVGLFFRTKRSDLLDTVRFVPSQRQALPEFLSGSLRKGGITFSYKKLDYRLNPRKGLTADLNILAGLRINRPDKKILPREVLDAIQAEQAITEWELKTELFVPTLRKQTLRLANQTYYLDQQQYFQNDLRQVGGGRSIRGFDENQFFTHLYTFFSVEWRLLLDKNSNILAFYDWAYLENGATHLIQRPQGFGFGFYLDTGKAGLLSISYGIGSLGGQTTQASRGKLHIGLANRF